MIIMLFFINFSGFEISDVLKIDDKDYAITFSLYFRSVLSMKMLNHYHIFVGVVVFVRVR